MQQPSSNKPSAEGSRGFTTRPESDGDDNIGFPILHRGNNNEPEKNTSRTFHTKTTLHSGSGPAHATGFENARRLKRTAPNHMTARKCYAATRSIQPVRRLTIVFRTCTSIYGTMDIGRSVEDLGMSFQGINIYIYICG